MRALTAIVLGCAFAGSGLTAGAATIPYTNSFSGVDGNVDLPNESGNGSWSIVGEKYRSTLGASSAQTGFALLEVANAAKTNFTMTTQFTVASSSIASSQTSNQIGFVLFADTATSPLSYYLADYSVQATDGSAINDEGVLRLIQVGGPDSLAMTTAIADANIESDTLGVVVGETYTLRLDVTSNLSGSITLSLGLFDELGTTQIGSLSQATTTNSPKSGQYFGLRSRTPVNGNLTIDYDNLQIVPEPASMATLAAMGLIAAGRRRRSMA